MLSHSASFGSGLGSLSQAMSLAGLDLGEPVPPHRLTELIPDPQGIEQQKADYNKGLDDQLMACMTSLSKQLAEQTAQIHEVGNQQKRQYAAHVDVQVKAKEAELLVQHDQRLLLLQQASAGQKGALEQQATALSLDYAQKKSVEDLRVQKYRFEKEQYDAKLKYNAHMAALQQQQLVLQTQAQGCYDRLAQQSQAASMTGRIGRVPSSASIVAAATAPA